MVGSFKSYFLIELEDRLFIPGNKSKTFSSKFWL